MSKAKVAHRLQKCNSGWSKLCDCLAFKAICSTRDKKWKDLADDFFAKSYCLVGENNLKHLKRVKIEIELKTHESLLIFFMCLD